MSAKRVIITGAASGIAAATMAELRARGATAVGLDLNTEGADLVPCDVRDQGVVDDAVEEAISRLGGGVDVLINCAGLATPQSAGSPPDERALSVLDVNMVGPWRMTSAALPALRRAHGRVVNVASGMAFVALPFAAAYAMSKHGVVAYSQALRLEFEGEIDVTTVYPGYIRTPIHEDSIEFGLTLAGSSPEESLESAVAALCKAALAEKPPRDIVTTRTGSLTTALSRHAPGRLVDRIVLSQVRKGLAGQKLGKATGPLGDFVERMTRGSRA